jgi:dTMP kinase
MGTTPDIVFVVDVPVALSRARLAARDPHVDRLEAEGDAFHERVRMGFLDLAKQSPRYHVIDGQLSPQDLVERAYHTVAHGAAR